MFNWMKKAAFTATLLLAACLITGCNSDRVKQQETYRLYGINSMNSGKYEEALTAFQNALDLCKGTIGEREIDICFYKAKTLYLSGATEDAIATYSSIIDYNNDASARYLRGTLYYEIGQPEEGRKDLEAALAVSRDFELHLEVCRAFAEYGETELATKYLNNAINLTGDGADDLLWKGKIYQELEDYTNAASCYTRSLEKGKEEANFYLAMVYSLTGDEERAKYCLDAYLAGGAADAQSLGEYGELQLSRGKYEDAILYFEAALQLENRPNDQQLRRGLVTAYEYAGDFEAAKNLLLSYLKDYPDDTEAQREYTFLETR